ncbi:MAG TPA: hypothetical protein EYM83_03975 [Nitrospirales bacterium]|nr:hypothetical protein [Nitrospirales bacterium]
MLTKKWHFNRCALFSLLVLLVLAGCGDDQIGSAGQCGGAESSGICVTINSIAPGSLGLPSSDDVDAFQNPDCDGDPATNDPEDFSRHSANVTLSVTNLIPTNVPGETAGVPTFVTLTQYRIEYTADAGNVLPVPTLTNRVFNETIRIDVNADATVTIALLELAQLNEYAEQALQGGTTDAFQSYTVKYTFSGQDSLGNPVSVAAFKKIQIGDFDTC